MQADLSLCRLHKERVLIYLSLDSPEAVEGTCNQ